ncbi:MAG: tetratricopeptide repeat protein [Planctomycetaceae bacterium]
MPLSPQDSGRLKSAECSPAVIPILGMHRSGTSMVARALNLMGLELGQPLLEATPDNPHGYWENTFFVQVNAELLQTLRCDPDGFAPPEQLLQLPKLCERVVVEDHRREHIRQFIRDGFSSSVWGWKDPRTVLTFGVWQRLLTELGYSDIRPVVVVRHPEPAMRSLIRRAERGTAGVRIQNGELAVMAGNLWQAYNRILWDYCVRNDWLICTYESLTCANAAVLQLKRLARYCGLDEARADLAAESIRHTGGGAGSFGAVDGRLVELYERFGQRTAPGDSSVIGCSDPDEARLLRRAEDLKRNGRIDAAVELLEKALNLRPQYRAARFLLGYTLMETGHITRSAEHSNRLIEANPNDAAGHGLRAFGLTQQARIEDSITAFRECLRCLPSNNVALSNLLFSALYGDHHDADAVTQLHIEASREIERNVQTTTVTERLPPLKQPGAGSPPLRIGYLSGDLKKHPVGYFLRSILEHHDRRQVTACCYHTSPAADDLTAILKAASDEWCDAHTMSDEQLTGRIRLDNIDVLVDLSGHSAGNRAGVIVRRAAPVQVMYLGYPCTSGFTQMDYVLSDSHLSPARFENLYTERVQRLDHCFLCFHPHPDAPEVAPPPCEANGFITFGSFNNLPKISPTTIRLWSDVLKAVPNSRLAIKALSFVDEGTRELFAGQFEQHGITRSRIDLLPPTVPLAKFLHEYRRIDIGLDPLPYNGGTTTCEALWMGVPVITLPGRHFFERMGLSILKNLGCEEWIAESAEDFVRRAADVAGRPEQLRRDRRALRDRIRDSPLCDGTLFTQGLERAYCSMASFGGGIVDQ